MQIALNRPQSLAHQALQPGHSVCTPWGRGIGKSWFQRLAWYENVARYDGQQRAGALRSTRGVRIVHLMPTFKACKDIHGALTDEDLGRAGEWGFLGAKIDHTSWKITFPGGSWVQWFGTKEANSARGIRCDVVTADECDDIDPAVMDGIVKPWFSEPWSLRKRLFGGTPRRGRYGLLYQEHKAGLDGNAVRSGATLASADEREQRRAKMLATRFSYHATYRDAPETVDANYVQEVRADLEMTGKLAVFEREWECNFDSAEGLVYAVFDETFHVRPAPNVAFTEFLVGMDHGYEDPGVILVAGVVGNGRDATIYLLEEVYKSKQPTSWWVARAGEINRKYGGRWYVDPSRPDVIADLRKIGCRFGEVDNSIEPGIQAVVDRLAIRRVDSVVGGEEKFARMYVHPQCVNTIAEFGKYRRQRNPQNRDEFLDTPVDKYNHAMDSARYLTLGRFGKTPSSRSEYGAGF